MDDRRRRGSVPLALVLARAYIERFDPKIGQLNAEQVVVSVPEVGRLVNVFIAVRMSFQIDHRVHRMRPIGDKDQLLRVRHPVGIDVVKAIIGDLLDKILFDVIHEQVALVAFQRREGDFLTIRGPSR